MKNYRNFPHILNKVIHVFDREIDYMFFRRFVSWRTVYRHHRHRYSKDAQRATNTKKMVIFMADGFRRGCGLADRLRGIVSLFGYCLDHDIDFRINFTYPFELSRYLMPAEYDWRISPDQICWNSNDAKAFHLMTVNGDDIEREMIYQHKTLNRCFKSDKFKQAHVYTVFFCEDKRFSALFKMLFRPTPQVQTVVDEVKHRLGKGYISISTRFMELLGDFVEPKQARTPLNDEQQQELMDACIAEILHLRKDNCKVLLTSDSSKFLHYASSRLDFVEYIEGDVCHICVDSSNRDAADLKTFGDFFAIAGAMKSYLLIGPGMYPSNFSRRAAQADGHEFNSVPIQIK